MKAKLLLFSTGLATGAGLMWLIQSNTAPDGLVETKAAARALDEKQKLAVRVTELEKKLQAAESKESEAGGKLAAKVKEQIYEPAVSRPFEAMLREHFQRNANREADKMALRLKLTPEQKAALKTYLLTQGERQRAMVDSLAKSGGQDFKPTDPAAEKAAFLNSLLTPEQQAEFAKAKEEDRTAKAEEYAQSKVRKLNNDLNLSEEQKDKLFQTFAQRKLAPPDAAGKTAQTPADAIMGATVAVFGGAGGPMDIDVEGLIGGDAQAAADREMLSGILTPEQLAVYDQRREDEKQGGGTFQMQPFGDVGTGVSGSISIQVGEPDATPAPPK